MTPQKRARRQRHTLEIFQPSLNLPLSPLFQLEAARAAAVPIAITLPDGDTHPGTAGVSTPMDIAKAVSPSLAKATVVAKVRGGGEEGTVSCLFLVTRSHLTHTRARAPLFSPVPGRRR